METEHAFQDIVYLMEHAGANLDVVMVPKVRAQANILRRAELMGL